MKLKIIHSKAARPVVIGHRGTVASGHLLASVSGLQVLKDGGNAVDAALATAFTVAMVKPDTCGPGGDLFALVYMKKQGRVEALNASGPAPAKATIEMFRKKRLNRIPTHGPLSIAVPGAVDGWLELHGKYGTFELERLVQDAVAYGREGFPLTPFLAARIEELSSTYPSIRQNFHKPLGDLNPGKRVILSELADTLEQIAKDGRDGFYLGEIGKRICAAVQAKGGVLNEEDLQGKYAEWLEPLTTSYKDYLLFEQPPVSQGFIVLEMLNILEGFALQKMERSEAIHLMVEAKKLAFEDRIKHLDDPRFGDPEVSRLISKAHGKRRRSLIMTRPRVGLRAAAGGGGETTYLCVADGEGNVVSLIQSIFAGFGSRVIAGDTGVIMNNRLCSFVLDPRKANALKPGKRPAHTLNSYMVFCDDQFFGVGGSPGADDQPQTNLQVLHNLLDRQMDPQSAVEAPRWSHSPGTPPRHRLPELLSMEAGFSPDIIRRLERKGHRVKTVGPWSFGSAKVILRDPVTGAWMAGADPRREAYAIGC
ncbi:MAG TPA: gamma-glutamyltransferase [Candidatus Binatia bacterium]|nr:gamma-glutamyltransferase [Candidatus Binatia bacterium]